MPNNSATGMMDRNTGSARRAAKGAMGTVYPKVVHNWVQVMAAWPPAIGVRKPPKLAPMPTAMIISMADLDLSSLEGES